LAFNVFARVDLSTIPLSFLFDFLRKE